MKKLLILALALMLLLPSIAALAETYTHGTVAYSIEFPKGWTVLSRETMDSALEAGLEELNNETLSSLLATVEKSDLVVALAPDFSTNVNVIVSPSAQRIEAEAYQAQQDYILEALAAQIPNVEALGEGRIIELDNGKFFELAYQTDASGVMQKFYQYYIHSDSYLYILTLTLTNVEMDEGLRAEMDAMLSSLKMI